MQLIKQILQRPNAVSFRFGANFFVASFLFFAFLTAVSSYAQGGSDLIVIPFDTTHYGPYLPDSIAMHEEQWRIGVYIGMNVNRYGADDMHGLPGVPSCCPGYNSGQGIGIAIGGLTEYPVNDWLALGARIYFTTYNGALIDEEAQTVDGGGFAETAIIQHRIDADIWSVAVEPVALFNVTDEFKLFAGLRGDLIAKKQFSQREEILTPDDIVFENGTPQRLVHQGRIPNQTSMQGAVVGGLRYDFDFGTHGQFVISPELSFWYGFSPVITNESWQIHGLRFAVSGQFLSFVREEELEVVKTDKKKTKPDDTPEPVVLPVSEDKERGNPRTGSGG